jgi:hypothetical protein
LASNNSFKPNTNRCALGVGLTQVLCGAAINIVVVVPSATLPQRQRSAPGCSPHVRRRRCRHRFALALSHHRALVVGGFGDTTRRRCGSGRPRHPRTRVAQFTATQFPSDPLTPPAPRVASRLGTGQGLASGTLLGGGGVRPGSQARFAGSHRITIHSSRTPLRGVGLIQVLAPASQLCGLRGHKLAPPSDRFVMHRFGKYAELLPLVWPGKAPVASVGSRNTSGVRAGDTVSADGEWPGHRRPPFAGSGQVSGA